MMFRTNKYFKGLALLKPNLMLYSSLFFYIYTFFDRHAEKKNYILSLNVLLTLIQNANTIRKIATSNMHINYGRCCSHYSHIPLDRRFFTLIIPLYLFGTKFAAPDSVYQLRELGQ